MVERLWNFKPEDLDLSLHLILISYNYLLANNYLLVFNKSLSTLASIFVIEMGIKLL